MCEHCAAQPHKDGYPILQVGEWSPNKLFYLGQYSALFTTGMKNRWRQRAYIDLFAGPGLNLVPGTMEIEDGSPLVALKQWTPFTDYVFVDSDADHVKALDARSANLALGSAKTTLRGNCNDPYVLEKILENVPESALCLTFADPFDFGIWFETLRALAFARTTDLIVVFHIASMKRALSYHPRALDMFFGDNGAWLRIYESHRKEQWRNITRALLNHYEERLSTLGYLRDNRPTEVLVRRQNMPLYYLIHASRHPRGQEFWEKATKRTPSGQRKMDL